MEALEQQAWKNGHERLVADFPGQVIVALDHLTSKEQQGVYAAVDTFARGEQDGRRLPLPEPLYVLRAAPDVLVIVRRESGAPVEVEDIVRPAALRNFADVNGG